LGSKRNQKSMSTTRAIFDLRIPTNLFIVGRQKKSSGESYYPVKSYTISTEISSTIRLKTSKYLQAKKSTKHNTSRTPNSLVGSIVIKANLSDRHSITSSWAGEKVIVTGSPTESRIDKIPANRNCVYFGSLTVQKKINHNS